MLLLYCLIVVLPLLFLYYRRMTSRLVQLAGKIPGPKPIPLLGNALEFGSNSSDFLIHINRLLNLYGSVVRIWIGSKLIVALRDPKDVEIILSSTKHITKSMDYTFLMPWLGTGLLTSTGEKWKKHRKMITPAFHFKILDQFVDVFNAKGDILIEKLKKEANGSEFNIYDYITLCALDIICETAMGVSVNAQRYTKSDYVMANKTICNIIVHRTFKPWLRINSIFPFTSYGKTQSKCLTVLHGMTNKVIKQKKAELLLNGFSKENGKLNDDEVGSKKKLAFLDLLIQSSEEGSNLSDAEIREEVDTFMFEGHDTTASGMSFALWCLANHPKVQEKVVEELWEILSGDDRAFNLRDLQEMKYLERVIKEAQRMFPSVPMYARELAEEVVLTRYTLPANTTCVIVAYAMQHNAELFPEPENFNPDRFLPENTLGRHPFSYVPFSAGPRNCIGQKFAMLEIKSTIAKVLRNYKLLPQNNSEEMLLATELVLKSQNGIKLKLVPRQ